MRDRFTFCSVNYNLWVNNNCSMFTSQAKTTIYIYCLHCFSYLSDKLWNSLPEALRSCNKINEFIQKILSFINFVI